MNGRWQFGAIRQPEAEDDPRPLVLKIGGSLLSLPGWPHLLEALIARVGDVPLTVVVGGGAIVEGLREIDAAAPQPAGLMHDLAIDAMHFTARLVSRATGLAIMARPSCTASAGILDVPLWLMKSDAATALPASWDVTSDSLAACVARDCGAGLMLAKASPPPPWPERDDQGTLRHLAEAGWIDHFFPTAATGVARIGWCAPRETVATSATRRRADS